MKTLCLFGADVAKITGRSERYGNMILSQIRKKNGKPRGHCVTLREVCEHLDICYEDAERVCY
ncbi:hypothetical protein [uncultured Planktosalinus sp.]|uniref:hypothetical protein n=1 Tax=uncultured Planktosalinus sp. TaxID=1810935 RepID=UPI0030D8683C